MRVKLCLLVVRLNTTWVHVDLWFCLFCCCSWCSGSSPVNVQWYWLRFAVVLVVVWLFIESSLPVHRPADWCDVPLQEDVFTAVLSFCLCSCQLPTHNFLGKTNLQQRSSPGKTQRRAVSRHCSDVESFHMVLLLSVAVLATRDPFLLQLHSVIWITSQ